MKVRRIDFSPDEYLAGIAGMSAEDQGVYWLICALIASSGHPIHQDDERLKVLCGCHGNKLNSIIDRLVQRSKITRNGREMDQKRVRKELESAEKRSENARENVSKRWHSNGLDNVAVLQHANANHQPSTTNYQDNPLTPLRRGLRSNGSNPRATADRGINPEAFNQWGHQHLTDSQLSKRFNDKSISREERSAIRQFLHPGATDF